MSKKIRRGNKQLGNVCDVGYFLEKRKRKVALLKLRLKSEKKK